MPEPTGTILDYAEHGPETDGGVAQSPAFKEGRPSDHEHGVFYFAPWEPVADGFAEHCRRQARALALTGEPVLVRSFFQRIGGGEDSDEFRAIEELMRPLLRASISRPKVEIYQLVPSETALFRYTGYGHPFLSEADNAMVNRFRIFYTVWERDRATRGAVQALKRVGQCWTGCEANRAMLERSGVPPERLRVVPLPFFPDDPHIKLWGRARKPGPVRFYHIGKWEPRKAQDRIVLAFLLAFRPGEAELILKTSDLRTKVEDYPQGPAQAVHAALLDPAVRKQGWSPTNVNLGVKIVSKRLPAEKIVEMHALGDIYVTLSRGEGWDLPAFDAKLSGNIMVYTPSGGPQDFAGVSDLRVEPSGSIKCNPFYQWSPDAEYLDYPIDAAVEALRAALKLVPIRTRVPDVELENFEAATVGARMRQCINELIESVPKS
jgi:glycosyltransferase involved in cell wall biosynthesis